MGHQVRIGTSGWQYADWREVLYPRGLPQREWLRRYAEVFDTVELNNSFYGLPKAESFARWRDSVPPGFVIATKLSRYLTHVRGLRDPDGPVHLFMERASHLGPHLGPVVMQLPPTRAKDEDGLDRTLKAFPAHVRVAVEFRHPSWFVDRVCDILHRHNASLVWADRGGRLQNPDWITADWLYLRLHGGRGTAGNYGQRVIDTYAQQLSNLGRDAYVYFNNDTSGNAVRNARALDARLRSSPP
ncbi:MAG: DUF72 domain-containing protein [Candidatus Dormiibacterota bacterium]